ncbi:Alpha/beta fold hydrolase [Planctomycetales bacterium 10988]|nr:Alpha/beta fold hydrolase [Planctomycetales bacterium 10988]
MSIQTRQMRVQRIAWEWLPVRICLIVSVVMLLLWLPGCVSESLVRLRSQPHNPLSEKLMLTAKGGPRPSERTDQVLRRYEITSADDPEALLRQLSHYCNSDPCHELYYALAELSYVEGKRLQPREPERAMHLYWNAVLYSYTYLFSPQFQQVRNPYDPQFREACDVYNGALEEVLREAEKRDLFRPGVKLACQTPQGEITIKIVPRGFNWQAEDFDEFEFVSDYDLQGLENRYQTHGLGVPLVAKRNCRNTQVPQERYFPPHFSFPVTAFLRLHHSPEGDVTGAELELFDPLEQTDIVIHQTQVPLETDLSTPLAYFLQDVRLDRAATFGLLRPDQAQSFAGLYMLQPYQPHKIPVLMVHGLWSSPMTWMEAFNDLQSEPIIRENFQFWFYLYPTGQPFWVSASQLRGDLQEMRQVFDPMRKDHSLDHMVLVGHSMGGLISRLLALDGGDRFWNLVSSHPLEDLTLTPEKEEQLRQLFFFEGERSIGRVVTVATPHRGSEFANNFTRWLGRNLISLPGKTTTMLEHLVGQERNQSLADCGLDISTSVDSLAPDSPILTAMLQSPLPPHVPLHNIVGITDGTLSLAENTDGVVNYQSAHMDEAVSELVVPAFHERVHRHPLAILEVRRILLIHLKEMGRVPQELVASGMPPVMQMPTMPATPGMPPAMSPPWPDGSPIPEAAKSGWNPQVSPGYPPPGMPFPQGTPYPMMAPQGPMMGVPPYGTPVPYGSTMVPGTYPTQMPPNPMMPHGYPMNPAPYTTPGAIPEMPATYPAY